MLLMRPRTRLALSLAMIVASASYGLLIVEDTNIAEAVAMGYVAVLLTVFFAVNLWKKP